MGGLFVCIVVQSEAKTTQKASFATMLAWA